VRFLADECCSAGVVAALRAEGHDVVYVIETDAGADDDAVLESAYREQRILLTEDKDFGELVYRLQMPAAGIILLRIATSARHLNWPRLKLLLMNSPERLPKHFVTVTERSFRFRPLIRT
jgi:predicted nuclease of predicted toxin-antitoxin system